MLRMYSANDLYGCKIIVHTKGHELEGKLLQCRGFSIMDENDIIVTDADNPNNSYSLFDLNNLDIEIVDKSEIDRFIKSADAAFGIMASIMNFNS